MEPMRFWPRSGAKAPPLEDDDAFDLEDVMGVSEARLTGKIAPLNVALGFTLRERDGIPTVVWSNKCERPATETEVVLHERIVALENELAALHKFMTDKADDFKRRIVVIETLKPAPTAVAVQPIAAATPAVVAPTLAVPAPAAKPSLMAAPTAMSEERKRELKAKFRNRSTLADRLATSDSTRPKLPG
jgi:hypothetical protein